MRRLRLSTDSRLPLGYRVAIGIGGLLALVAACVVVAILLLNNLQDDQAELYQRNVPYSDAIATAALNAKGIANDERGFLLSGEQKFLTELEDRIVEARQAFALAEAAATDLAQLEAAGDSRTGFERWIRALRSEIEMYEAGDREGAITVSLGPVRDLRKSYEESLARADDLASTVIESRTDSVTSAHSRSVVILVVSLIIALLIGFGIAFWLLRTIIRPVHGMLALYADALQRGNELLDSPRGNRRWAR